MFYGLPPWVQTMHEGWLMPTLSSKVSVLRMGGWCLNSWIIEKDADARSKAWPGTWWAVRNLRKITLRFLVVFYKELKLFIPL